MNPATVPTLHDLPRADALLALEIHRFVTKDLGVAWQGSSLLTALSGGSDSTALLVLMVSLRDHLGFRVTAAHLDHGLRPESAADAAACADLCEQLNVPLQTERADVAAEARRTGQGLEEAGRRIRYDFLDRARLRAGADWVLTAHHAGDLAEDVLLRLVRGASWPALGGMKAVDPKRRILRPLLMTDRERLAELLLRRGISWREDPSNRDRAFRRNRIRLDILPLLVDENPSFGDVVRQLWRTARRDEDFWEDRIAGLPVSTPDGMLLPSARLGALPPAGRLRAYVAAVHALKEGQPRASTLFQLDDAWERRRHGGRFLFPGGITALVSAEGVLFARGTGIASPSGKGGD